MLQITPPSEDCPPAILDAVPAKAGRREGQGVRVKRPLFIAVPIAIEPGINLEPDADRIHFSSWGGGVSKKEEDPRRIDGVVSDLRADDRDVRL